MPFRGKDPSSNLGGGVLHTSVRIEKDSDCRLSSFREYIIDNVNGFIINMKSAKQIASFICNLESSSNLDDVRSYGFDTVSNYTLVKIAERYEQIYDSLISMRKL